MSTGLRVLVIEDQYDIAANIWDFLERRDYRVDHAADGVAGLARAQADEFDLIVLDLGLPRLDGLALCRQLRSSGHATPILMLTARDTLDDKLRGFAEGADDYLVKPFAMKELEARLRALHRRHRGSPAPSLQVGDLQYDPAAMLALRQGRRIALTKAQAGMLQLLMQQSPNVVSHAALGAVIWNDPDGGDSAALHTHVYELRKLVDRPFGQALIHGVRGLGYRLAPA